MKNLQLPLIVKWFEMTKTVKKEDYRSITPYWIKRLFNGLDELDTTDVLEDICSELRKREHSLETIWDWYGIRPKQFYENIMTLGYPKSTDTSRILHFKHAGIEIRTGDPEWGAEPGKLYFVIKHGDRVL